jgi:glucosylceramidase
MKSRFMYVILTIIVAFFGCKNTSINVKGKEASQNEPIYSSAQFFLTAKNTGDRLTDKGTLVFEPMPQPEENAAVIMIDAGKAFQEFVGIGGALTDAAAETFSKLPQAKKNEFITAVYDSIKGIGYSLGRTHIHSCDFSSESYTYVQEGDSTLNSFSIAHDLKFRVPLIKEALKYAPGLKIYVSPWSPPAWMKTNNDMLHGGKLRPEFAAAWAKYYTRFIEEYQKQGIPIWGLTVQNEPMAVQTWESCIYTAEDERDFVKNNLGPQLKFANMSNLKLMIWDHNRGIMFQRAKTVLDDPEASKYVWGTGFHWYVGDHFDNVRMVHDAWPDKQLLFTEGCNGPFDWKTISDWNWGENYGRSIIHDLNNWAAGWTDWNILVDEKGGPNHVGNYCFAPIVGDTRDGSLHYMNSYWYIGHFSKFIRPGAKRIICSSNMDELIATAFLNKDGTCIAVVMNESNKAMTIKLWANGKAVSSNMPEHSIASFRLSK